MSMKVNREQFLGIDRMDEDELRDFVYDLHAENARLRSCLSDDAENAKLLMGENARLREELDERDRFADASKKWMGKAAHFEAENARLRSCLTDDVENARLIMAENAKLRELLSSLWKRVHSPVRPNVERDYLSEMRELGVEVN